jgi:hypothetical protein
MVGSNDVLQFLNMMFTSKFKYGLASNLYKPLHLFLCPLKQWLVFLCLTKHVLRRNY